MTMREAALDRLRADAGASFAWLSPDADVRFVALGGRLEQRWQEALADLDACISPFAGSEPTLSEGGVYHGAWIESTGTINTESLARFAPHVAKSTHLLFAHHQRDDGLIPYKVTADGPAFSQIQIVTPFARTVWRHYLGTDRDRDYLRTMYEAMARMDRWLVDHRDTRGTGSVEAFCTFDTGHDNSPRFAGIPDRCFEGDAANVDPTVPSLPFIAPDLTANVACQRLYLALIAAELGEPSVRWTELAKDSFAALWSECYDEAAATFFDRDAVGDFVRVESDVLLRVLACEVGDDTFFEDSLHTHLMNRSKFFAPFGFPSIALDDPLFNGDYTQNSWAGPSNYLSAIRAPDAFEHHGRVAELAMFSLPLLRAAIAADRFPQCVDPFTGTPGFTEVYSPAILWFLDAVERSFGVLPRPNGDVWISALSPHLLDARTMAHGRTVKGVRYEVAVDDDGAQVWRDGHLWLAFPCGWRIELAADGEVTAAVCLSADRVAGELTIGSEHTQLSLAPNDRADLRTAAQRVHSIGLVRPTGETPVR